MRTVSQSPVMPFQIYHGPNLSYPRSCQAEREYTNSRLSGIVCMGSHRDVPVYTVYILNDSPLSSLGKEIHERFKNIGPHTIFHSSLKLVLQKLKTRTKTQNILGKVLSALLFTTVLYTMLLDIVLIYTVCNNIHTYISYIHTLHTYIQIVYIDAERKWITETLEC